jgi:hypothetical protein
MKELTNTSPSPVFMLLQFHVTAGKQFAKVRPIITTQREITSVIKNFGIVGLQLV